MSRKKSRSHKRYYTPEQANAALPLVRAIIKDVVGLCRDARERQERLLRLHANDRGSISTAHEEEVIQAQGELERDDERMRELERELADLGIELKDPFTGLIDFRYRLDGRDVYLCWRLGESSVAHWHELDAGFAGRQKLVLNVTRV